MLPPTTSDAIRDVISQLETPVPDVDTLLVVLTSILHDIGLLPPQYAQHNTRPLRPGAVHVPKHIATIQGLIITHIEPTWGSVLKELKAEHLLKQFFCPDSFSFTSPKSGDIALTAHSTILSLPISEYTAMMLSDLCREYPIDRVYSAVFPPHMAGRERQNLVWEDHVRNLAAVPAKVANALGPLNSIPPALEHGAYFHHLSLRCECLIRSLALADAVEVSVAPVNHLLAKLVQLGVFPAVRPAFSSQPSFFQSTLSEIRRALSKDESKRYSQYWREVFSSFISTFTLKSILVSLISALQELEVGLDVSYAMRSHVKQQSLVLYHMVGPLLPERTVLFEVASSLGTHQDWNIGHARLLTCWAGEETPEALVKLLQYVIGVWTSAEHINHSLLSRHQYSTSLLLLLVSYLPSNSAAIQSLASSPRLLSGVGNYINHSDASIRRCGMLVAEAIAGRAGKELDFGDWEGEGEGRQWARNVRKLMLERDVDISRSATAESSSPPASPSPRSSSPVTQDMLPADYDSDDSLTGYASDSESRSNSPTPSELEEIAKDPTLGIGAKKIHRPVYLSQLGDMIRSAGGLKQDSNQDADRIEIALNFAEELIRKKKGYGSELEENAVNIAYGLIGLQNNYELDGFDRKRQDALRALVACCPRKAAPAIIEQFYMNQYSTNQRFAMLNALALGSRELASLPIPESSVQGERIAFPSKLLPEAKHQQYIAGQDPASALPLIMGSISDAALRKSGTQLTNSSPAITRERRLRMNRPTQIREVGKSDPTKVPAGTSFNDVAAEFFILPIINRLWLFMRDEQTREDRTAHLEGRSRYQSAGTGLILNPLVLSHLLATLGIIVHASQHAPEWSAIIGPEALEVAVTLGTKPISLMELDSHKTAGDEERLAGKDASVLTSALELALVVLDAYQELDGGRVLSLEHTVLLRGTAEWATGVFDQMEKGVKVNGGGGAREVSLRRAVAGVLLQVEEISNKWQRSMVGTW